MDSRRSLPHETRPANDCLLFGLIVGCAVLSNLVGNAVKMTTNGFISLRVVAEDEEFIVRQGLTRLVELC